MREQIAHMVRVPQNPSDFGRYETFTIIATILSVLPLAFKGTYIIFEMLEVAITVFFTIDYLLRWITADISSGRSGPGAFLRHPFTFSAIVDLVSLIPGYISINPALRALRTARLVRLLKVTMVFRALRYSKSVVLIGRVLRRQRDTLIAVSLSAAAFVLVSALVVFNVEPDTFPTFFDAVYWAIVSLTTVGYGDIYPVTTAGRVVTLLCSVFGIAVITLPVSIFTAGFMEELEIEREEQR